MQKGGGNLEHFNEIMKYALEIMAILGVTIEIIPVKFSPFRWIGNKLNGDIREQIDKIEQRVDTLQKTTDYNDIATIRNRISSFENLCRLDAGHNTLKKHQYTTVFKDIDTWEKYHEKYPDLNGELKLAIENIKKSYNLAKFDN